MKKRRAAKPAVPPPSVGQLDSEKYGCLTDEQLRLLAATPNDENRWLSDCHSRPGDVRSRAGMLAQVAYECLKYRQPWYRAGTVTVNSGTGYDSAVEWLRGQYAPSKVKKKRRRSRRK